MNNLPSQEILKQLLDYDPITGQFKWKVRDISFFKDTKKTTATAGMNHFNSQFAGKEAFTCIRTLPAGHQYYCGRINYQNVLAHRVAWKWMTGEDALVIDHDDRDGLNNKWNNLRNVNQGINCKNQKLYSNNTSGHVGVLWQKSSRKWKAQISHKVIGYFDDIESAIKAREEAQQSDTAYHPNHGSPQ